MDSFLVTPASEAEFNLLAALFAKMQVRVRSVSDADLVGATAFIPGNRAEEALVEGIRELREIRAGRHQAQTVEEFWQEVAGE
ncbi:hypothetical protein [Hymenobacter aerophilus]|uniref:hypothetical protein n=1 Tax=Hymenobacter aerophilus TaxID=119644 RepID=UPI0003809D45|nr:hypothetical protein [Hymenobacter aerophilus]